MIKPFKIIHQQVQMTLDREAVIQSVDFGHLNPSSSTGVSALLFLSFLSYNMVIVIELPIGFPVPESEINVKCWKCVPTVGRVSSGYHLSASEVKWKLITERRFFNKLRRENFSKIWGGAGERLAEKTNERGFHLSVTFFCIFILLLPFHL